MLVRNIIPVSCCGPVNANSAVTSSDPIHNFIVCNFGCACVGSGGIPGGDAVAVVFVVSVCDDLFPQPTAINAAKTKANHFIANRMRTPQDEFKTSLPQVSEF
jgi:hypothetical protein